MTKRKLYCDNPDPSTNFDAQSIRGKGQKSIMRIKADDNTSAGQCFAMAKMYFDVEDYHEKHNSEKLALQQFIRKYKSEVPLLHAWEELSNDARVFKQQSSQDKRVQLAKDLMLKAGLEIGIAVNLNDLTQLCDAIDAPDHPTRYRVYDEKLKLVATNATKDDDLSKITRWIPLLFRNNHYDLIRPNRIHTLFEGNYNHFCFVCNKAFQKQHICSISCSGCHGKVSHASENSTFVQSYVNRNTHRYHRKQSNVQTWSNHLHFYKFERVINNTGYHDVNWIESSDKDGKFDQSFTDIDEWLMYILQTHGKTVKEKVNFIAHNVGTYDMKLILNRVEKMSKKMHTRNVEMSGSKIISFELHMGPYSRQPKREKGRAVMFLDSVNYLCMSLAKFPETFGFKDDTKGFFPRLFNKKANSAYEGPIPDREYFEDQVKKDDGFETEIAKYCKQDVNILRLGWCKKFRE